MSIVEPRLDAVPAPSAFPQLLLTKLYLPPARADQVSRPRLADQLAAGIAGPLTVISAPAGFGKTSLFSAWRSFYAPACRVAWLSLDPDDDDPSRFLQYLTGALETAMPGKFGQVAVMFRLPQLPPVKTVLAELLNCLAIATAGNGRPADPVILALDDYHVIENPEIHQAVEYLLDHLPPSLHVVILTRSDPPLRLARLRARGQLTELRAADLRFTLNETTEFLNEVMRLGLSPADIGVLDARTEGWIVGLKLAALRLSQPGLTKSDAAHFIQTFESNHRFAAEFLVEEVVSRQSPQVQEFLLRSSILERLCAPLCDELLRAVEASSDDLPVASAELIDQMVHRNLFIVPLDEEGYWFRYHHLLRDLLRARLARLHPERTAALHRAASAWFESQGLLKEAVKHAILTGDWDYAADMVEHHGVATVAHSELATVREWCLPFPEEVMRRRPALCIVHSWGLILSYKDEHVPMINMRLAQAEQALDIPGLPELSLLSPGKPPLPLRAWVLGNVTQLRAAMMLWPSYTELDPHTLITLAQESMELLADAGDGATDSVNSLNIAYAHMALGEAKAVESALVKARRWTFEGRNYYGAVTAIYYQAHLAFCQGKLNKVDEICAEGRKELSTVLGKLEQNLPAIRCLDVARGCVRLERGELLGAETALMSALDLFGWAPWIELTGYIALARLRLLQEDIQGAFDILAKLERLGPHVLLCMRGLALLAQLRVSPTDPEILGAAFKWGASIRPDLSRCVPMGIGPAQSVVAYYTYLAWAQVKVVLGEARTAFDFIEPALALAQEQGLLTRVIELSLVEALARNVLGESRKSWEALDRALGIAEHTGHVRTFEQGDRLKCLLAGAAARGMRRGQIHALLDAIGWPAESGSEGAVPNPQLTSAETPAHAAPLEPLSEREREILVLIAAGLSNAEIAARLFIGIGTVKTHVNHLFSKMAVSSRTQLIARARMLGLLS